MTRPFENATRDVERERNRYHGVGIVDDPYPAYHRLRSAGAVHEGSLAAQLDLAATGLQTPDVQAHGERPSFWVYGYDACEEVLRDDASFSSSWFTPLLSDTVGNSIISMDAPEHRRLRVLLQKAFSRREMLRWQNAFIRPIVDDYLDAIAPKGRCDLMSELCAKIPIHTIIRALGLPVPDRERFFELSVRMLSPARPPDERVAAAREVETYLAPLVEERRARPRDDLVSILALAEIADEEVETEVKDRRPLTDDEINSFVRLLIVAGAGTTYRQMGNLIYALLTHPTQLEAVLGDASLVPQAIEESLRWEPNLVHLGRIALRTVELGETQIPEGSTVNLNFGAANRDPARWDHPDEYDLFRPTRPHLAFGFGRHRCLGIHLARVELSIALSRVLERLPKLRLDPDAEPAKISGLGFRMPTSLPVRFG